MQLADIAVEFPAGEVTFEMSNLSPRETGLDFSVFVSLQMASHAAQIKVTQPPWGSKPEAVYMLSPYWDGNILYDQDLQASLIMMGSAR